MLFLFFSAAFAGGSASLTEGISFTDDNSGMRLDSHLVFEEQLALDPTNGRFTVAVHRLRPDFRASIEEYPVRARVQLELAGTPKVLDATLDFGPKNAYLRVGRLLLPTGRAQLTPVPKLLFQGFAPSADASRIGRDFGAMAAWSPEHLQLQTSLTGNGADDTIGWRSVTRVAVDIGDGVAYDETSALSGEAKPGLSVAASTQYFTVDDSLTLTAEVAAQAGPVRLQTEGFTRLEEEFGGYVQVSSTIVAEHLDLGLRFDHLQLADQTSQRAEAVISVYGAGPHLRVQTVLLADLVNNEMFPGAQLNTQLWF